MTSASGVLLEYLILSLFIAPLSLKFAGMDKKGSIAAFLVGLVVYVSVGLRGFLVLLVLHIGGAAVTRFGYDKKLSKGVAQKKRSVGNVFANGCVPALAAALTALNSDKGAFFFATYVSAIAAATADTVSSEIGELSMKRPRLITTFEEVEVGTDGAVSLLGTVSGLLAAMVIAFIAFLLNADRTPFYILFVTATIAGFIGMTVDSLLGATLERKKLIGNDLVNLLSVWAGFGASLAIYSVLS